MADELPPDGAMLAAVDLGSNSFHLILARRLKGELSLLRRMGEKVQLAAGLDENNWLSEEAQQRGLDCLKMMAPFLQGLSENQVRIVGTNALRAAHNAEEFITRAEAILGFPIEIIAGREEARLIFAGAVHTTPRVEGHRLVVDIGGGSTEFIIGEGAEPRLLESLHMGCVSYGGRYFPGGEVTERGYQRARTAALGELLHIQQPFRKMGWQLAQGSSGTLKALSQILGKGEFAPLTPEGIQELEKDLLKAGSAHHWTAYGMRADRVNVIPAGLAITSAFFESLGITEMHYSDGALREGVLYELLGSGTDEDIRERTVRALQERFQVDLNQSHFVTTAALQALEQTASPWGLMAPKWQHKLEWAARLHEIGLSVAHTQYHKHGAYLMRYADLAGFTRLQQQMLAVLIRAHRRKFPVTEFKVFTPEDQLKLQRLARLLRLAVVLHHSRPETPLLDFRISINNSTTRESMQVTFPEGWLQDQPLLRADLEQEAAWQAAAGFELIFV
ncbi:Ppx/GppA phosphatase family protein [Marinospirillum alkaliphilum]|uniref:Exopolyphosphatase / guanosine-5'-triphosphate,3'-diphosphate pyrophosphatase n=1 Tax=Marinospirillum alkaliphilum DSM 21637 TaxID=1122209 RepID=A0A1K1V6W6_9GAMM|nr:Ppx/GppA phosphatase family protein [Marinospirillum alkaliphilum]SFX20293.1 exopolyphosphatase / guanosine-5'-triphosphate,3'-diphosphate pyrophosphatase [Marinospirillum alkaliphilum DSM 21637]